MLERMLPSIDTYEFMDSLGLKNISRNGDWFNSCCPFHQDHSPSFGIKKDTKAWKCFSGCGGGDFVDFLMRFYECTRIEAISRAYEIAAGYFRDEEGFDSERVKQKINSIVKTLEKIKLPGYDPAVIEEWRYIHPYMIQRGISDVGTFRYFKCGYSGEHNLLTFPLFFLGEFVGVQSRRLDNLAPRYKPLPGYESPKGGLFYNYVPEYDRILLVEGIMDCIWLWQLGIKNVMAVMTNQLTGQQASLIKENFKEICLWLDYDEPGIRGTIKAIDQLGEHLKVEVAGYPEGRKDPAECTPQEIMMVRSNLISGAQYILKKLG